ncbi:MAG: hypothetical protein H7257_13040 [Taibaiella sp.]|nr:hypothetical protein [Taibaiella sp.]
MAGRFFLFIFTSLFLSFSIARAEDNNYNNHKKYFFLCSYTKECFSCESCSKELYKVKIKNNTDMRIKSVYYQYYSPLYQKVVTKEAIIEGDQVEKQDIGYLFICVKNKLHWAITKIVYEDNSDVTFAVDGPLKSYIQEPDECSCNVSAREMKY